MGKESIKRGIMGIACANFMSPLISLFISMVTPDYSSITIKQYMLFTVSSSLIGFTFAAASVLFQIESMSRLKATTIHFVCLLTSYAIAGLISNWIIFDIRILITIGSFLFSYLLSYGSIMIGLKVNENKINLALLRKQREHAG
jgi:hypothetical protein